MIEFHSKLKPKTTLDLTSMVDVMFILLIFFILSYNEIGLRGLNIALPVSQSGDNIKVIEKIPIIITLYSNGRTLFQREVIDASQIPHRVDSFIQKENYVPKVIIQGEENVSLQLLISTMDLIRNSGIKDVHIETRKETEEDE